MNNPIRIGLDLAKHVFQIHAVNAQEKVVFRGSKRLAQMVAWFRRQPPCLVGLEACGMAHYWARELSAMGHTVRLMPPNYVKAYLRRNKNDAADAAAICEAVSRPSMRFVTPKTPAQQAHSGIHRVREQLIRQRTQVSNSLRGLMAEFGILASQGRKGIGELIAIVEDESDTRLHPDLRPALRAYVAMLATLKTQLDEIDTSLLAQTKANQTARQLMSAPGIGTITASALVARVTDPSVFDSGRHFAASLGLTPRQDGTGGKVRLGAISKRGDGYLRRLLVQGAMSVLRSASAQKDPWIVRMLLAKPMKLVAVALANKMARVAWALMTHNEAYRPRLHAAA